MIGLETAAMIGIGWTLGIVTGWGAAYVTVIRKKAVPVRHAAFEQHECDTCGQIDSDLKGGLCAWCQRVYDKGQR